MKRKAIFLDRDGVLNDAIIKHGKPYPPASLAELVISDEVPQALSILKELGYLLIGATNQPDVARGLTDRRMVENINASLMTNLPLDDIRVCYHDDQDNCQCRKPLPGLLLQAAVDYNIDLQQSMMIGDRWKDIEAGERAQCKTIWLDKNYQEPKPKKPYFIAKSLIEAVHFIQTSLTIRDNKNAKRS